MASSAVQLPTPATMMAAASVSLALWCAFELRGTRRALAALSDRLDNVERRCLSLSVSSATDSVGVKAPARSVSAVAGMTQAELREFVVSKFSSQLSEEELKAAEDAVVRLELDGDAIVQTIEPDTYNFRPEDKLAWLGLSPSFARILAAELAGSPPRR